jgi:hypothetical protein
MKGEGSRICLVCHQPIIWVRTKQDWMIPIDPEPIKDGKMAITNGDPPTVRYLWYDMVAEEHEWLAISHLDTCPARERRPRRNVQHGRHPSRPGRADLTSGIRLGCSPVTPVHARCAAW